jgi:hypothetical protein
MPSGLSRKLRIRIDVVAHILRIRGCVLTRDVVAMGFTPSQARHALKYLASAGRAAHVDIGGVSLWCYSAASAVRHIERLRRALHEALCAARVRYASPGRAVKIIRGNAAAAELFSRYVSLSIKDTAALKFVSGLLQLAYGDPYGTKPVYAVNCGTRRSG